MSDQPAELQVPTTTAGVAELHRRLGREIHMAIELEQLVLRERERHQEQIASMAAALRPSDAPTDTPAEA